MGELEAVLEAARADEAKALVAVQVSTETEAKAEQRAAVEDSEWKELQARLLLADPKEKGFTELVKGRIDGRARIDALTAGLGRARAARTAAQAAAAEAERRVKAAELEIRRGNIAKQGEQLTAKVEATLDQLRQDLTAHAMEWQRGCALSRQLGLHSEPCRRTFWLEAADHAQGGRAGFMFQEIGRALEHIADYRRHLAREAAEQAANEARRHQPPAPPEPPRGPSAAMVEALDQARRRDAPTPDYKPFTG